MAEETTNNENTKVNDPFSNKGMFAVDEALGTIMGAKGPKLVDTKNIDKAIAGLEKPASGSIYDKLAARYRSKGEGAVLRTQKNLSNLFLPTIKLIQEREADALARYTLLKQGLEEFDDSTIFGQADGSEMPIVDEIKNLANMTKEDMRELSRLNPADERYDVLAKKIQKNNEAIAQFDDINQKLLEIRNAQDGSDDASQWSKGMTQAERDMWMDIYSGKGNNIKIQNGKLVWTDTRGETKYNFKDISDRGPKLKALGYNEDSNYDNDTDLGILHFYTMDGNKQGDRKFFEDGVSSNNTKRIQKSLNNLGFTDDDGNKLDVDGDFGDKTEEAYNKYLAKKDELETAYFNENLSEEDKQKYGSIVEGSVGQTRVIDLNNISSGPTMIENAATILERRIQGSVQDLINNGISINDPNYQKAVKSMIFQLNQTGPAGIKSLIFDGLNTDDDDIFTSENTNSFIEGVIANNAKEFGIEDPDNITPQQLEDAIEKLKQGDVTIQYLNKDGKKESLQRQFLGWYKELIDTKVEAGVKSKFSSTTGKFIKGGGSGGGGNKNKPTSTPSSFQESIKSETGAIKSSITLPSVDLKNEEGTKEITYDSPELYFKNGIGYVKLDDSGDESSIISFDKKPTELINYLQEVFKGATRSEIITYVNSQIDKSKNDSREINSRLNKLKTKNAKFGTGFTLDDYLLTFGDQNKVINALNDEYTDLGFTFKYLPALAEETFFSDKDELVVQHKDFPGENFKIRFDTINEETDLKRTDDLIAVMKALLNGDLKSAKSVRKGIHFKN